MKGIWRSICFGCLGLALAAILAACSSGDGGEYALRAVMSYNGPAGAGSESGERCDLNARDITVGEEAVMLLRGSFHGWRVTLIGPPLTLLAAPANAELEQLDTGEWRLNLPDVEEGDTEVAFVPQRKGEYFIECVGGFTVQRATMRVVDD